MEFKSVNQLINIEFPNEITLHIKREDLIHPFISGNKFRKLKYNLLQAKAEKKSKLLTFGGAFSNHLLATASACNSFGLKSIGIVRGNELDSDSNETLKRCNQLGMRLVFVSREEYQMRNEKFYQEELLTEHSNYYCIPEGGSNYYGMIGCQEILQETPNDYNHVFVAQGTTTTSAGIALSIPEKSMLHVVPVLKGFNSIEEMRSLYNYAGLESGMVNEILSKINVLSEYHFGGYGKYTNELLVFMESFFRETGIPLDPIYTGKTLFALMDWVEKNNVENANLLFIHTGGIQGGKAISEKEGSLFC